MVPNKIKNWLLVEELEFTYVIGEDARGTLFNFLVTLSSGTKVNLLQPSNKQDSVFVSAVLHFSDSQAEAMNQKSVVEREEIFSELRFKLVPLDVTVSFGDNTAVFSHVIYYDGINKDRLFKAVSEVDKAYSLADWLLKQVI